MSADYITKVRNMNSENRTEHLKKIETAFVKSKEYGDDKVQLAMQTYEMVSYIIIVASLAIQQLFPIQILLIFPRFELLKNVIFECYGPQT